MTMPITQTSRAFTRFRLRVTMLVPLALLVATWFWGPKQLPLPWLLGGLACVVAGSSLRVWASGYLVKDVLLVRWGPFRFSRNPLYLGTLLLGLGYCSFTTHWQTFLIVGLVVISIYLPTIRAEEDLLAARFGQPFVDYMKIVPRWLPRLTPAPLGEDAPRAFNWSLVKHNNEHMHLLVHLGLLITFAAVYLLKFFG